MTLVGDSALGWTVGYLLIAGFLALAVIPYLAARRWGRRAAGVLVLVWTVLGVGLTLAYGDLDGLDAVVAALLAFGVPWAIAGLLGAHAHSRRAGGDDRAWS